MSDLDLAPTPVSVTNDGGDHERFAHVVTPPSEVTRAMVTGEPCRALCGKLWIPGADPNRFPTCPDCKRICAERGWALPR